MTRRKIAFDKRKLKADKSDDQHPEYILPEIPFCQKCAARQRIWTIAGGFLAGLGFIGALIFTVWLDLGLGRWVNGWIFTICSIPFCIPGILLCDHRDRTVQVFAFTKDTITFSFKRADYAEQFMKRNKVHADAESALPG